MISKASLRLSDVMARNGIIKPEDAAVYSYGLELMISTFLSILEVIIISFILSEPLAGVLYMLAFIPIRSTAGGYHATTHLYCQLTFAISFTIFILAAKLLAAYILPVYLVAISVMNLITVLILSPIGTSKKPMTELKRKTNRKRSIIISTAYVLIGALSFFAGKAYMEYFTYFAMGQFAAMISMFVAIKLKR